MDGFSMSELISRVLKYLLEGAAVALAMVLIMRKMPAWEEVGIIALTAMTMFAVLDLASPSVGLTARQGAGFGLGANLVGFPRM
jgi:hypothetical protein